MEEHPDVFSDPDFSITQMDSTYTVPSELKLDEVNLVVADSSEAMSVGAGEQQEQRLEGKQVAWVRVLSMSVDVVVMVVY